MEVPDLKKKKKRSVRAHHEDLSTQLHNMHLNGAGTVPNMPSPNIPVHVQVPGQTPPVIQNQFQQQPPQSGQQFIGSSPLVQQHQRQESFGQLAPQLSSSILTLPSIAESRYLQQLDYTTPLPTEDGSVQYPAFLTFQNVVPPVAGTQVYSIDQGTAMAKFMRSTMYNVPESEQLRLATKLPVAITVRPFAPLLADEDPVPVVDMSQLGASSVSGPDSSEDVGPPRCRRCRTYMNPSMQHLMNGKFLCNICQFDNNTYPYEYSAAIDPMTGKRIDVNIRPELHKGVYDIIVPAEYNLEEGATHNEVLHHVFLIDISESSIKQNLPILIADTIRAVLYHVDEFVGKIAIMTFDKKIGFYNLSSQLETTQLSLLTDLDDPFIPFHDGLFVDPEESRHVIEDALNHLESLCQQRGNQNVLPDVEPAYAAACRTAMLCLKSVSKGGKITSVLSKLPSWGPGKLRFKDNRSVGRAPTSDAEKRTYNPDNEYYHLLAKDFIDSNVGLDVLVVSEASVDLSNIGWLCSSTGGTVTRWLNFNIERDGRQFTAKFVNSVNKCKGYQGQLKVRCSNGLQVEQYYGTSSSTVNTSLAVGGGPQDPKIPVVNEDQTFTVLFKYDGKLNTKYDCHFQAALLYTDSEGVRKVRVINLVLAVSERLEDVFNFVEQDSVVTTLVRDTLSFIGKQTFLELRESVNDKLVEVFTQYRAMCELGHNRNRTLTNQLLFPDSLKHLPNYLLCFIKSVAMRPSSDVSADARLAEIFEMLNVPIDNLMYRLYPGLVELHSLQEYEAVENPDNHGFITLPPFKPLTGNSLDQGVYLLCNAETVYVWIHPSANIYLIKDLFGEHIEAVEEIDPLIDEFPDLPTHISSQARNLVRYFQSNIIGCDSIGYSGIQIVREGIDGSSKRFKEYLVEDSLNGMIGINNGPSFADYLANLHKAIRVKLDNDKSSNVVKNSIDSVENNTSTLTQRLINF